MVCFSRRAAAAACVLLVLAASASAAAAADTAAPQSLFDILYPSAAAGKVGTARAEGHDVEVEHVTLMATVEKGCRCTSGCDIITEEIDYRCSAHDDDRYESERRGLELQLPSAMASCDWTWILTDPVEVAPGVSRGGSATATCVLKDSAKDCGPLCDGLIITAQGTRYSIDQVAFPDDDVLALPTQDDKCGSAKRGILNPHSRKSAAVSTANAATGGFVMAGAHVFAGTFHVTSPRHSFKFSTGEMTYVCARFDGEEARAVTSHAEPPAGVPVMRLGTMSLKFVKSGDY